MGDWPYKAAQSSEASLIPKQISYTNNGSKKSWPLYNANFASKTRKNMQERVARSSLLLEEEDMFKKVKLTEKRDFNPEDPLENKFRLAQSQYLSVSGQYASPIESVDYVENRILMENFEMKKNEFKSAGKDVKEYLLFHGTKDINIDSILKENFRMDYAGKHGQAYGRGIYFSEKTKIPNRYMNKEKRTLLLCRVLLGKEFLGEERDIPEGFDSKSVKPDQDKRACINIIKEINQILPCFVLNLAPTGSPHAQPSPVGFSTTFVRTKKSLILKRLNGLAPMGVHNCKTCPMVFTNAAKLLSHQKHHKEGCNSKKPQNLTKNHEFPNVRAVVDVRVAGLEKHQIQDISSTDISPGGTKRTSSTQIIRKYMASAGVDRPLEEEKTVVSSDARSISNPETPANEVNAIRAQKVTQKLAKDKKETESIAKDDFVESSEGIANDTSNIALADMKRQIDSEIAATDKEIEEIKSFLLSRRKKRRVQKLRGSKEFNPSSWNTLLKIAIKKVKSMKQASNVERIGGVVRRSQASLKDISDDVVEKKLDDAAKQGVLERIDEQGKVTYRIAIRGVQPVGQISDDVISLEREIPNTEALMDVGEAGMEKQQIQTETQC